MSADVKIYKRVDSVFTAFCMVRMPQQRMQPSDVKVGEREHGAGQHAAVEVQGGRWPGEVHWPS